MRKRRLSIIAVGAMILTAVFGAGQQAQAVQTAQDRVVRDLPASFTPNVLDGQVETIVQVGNTMIIGGQFTQVQAAGSTTTLTRNNILAFNATTGALSTTFLPAIDGEVTSLLVASDGQSVYAGGFFNTVNGAASKSLAKIDVANGQLVAGFTPPSMDGRVKDLRLTGGRLWVAGTFQTVAGQPRSSLYTANPTSGAVDPYMGLTIAGVHNGGTTQVLKMDVTPDGSKLVGIGNFLTVNGQARDQIFMLDLTGGSAALATWQTNFYTSTCASVFNTYMRDLDISPDGSYFVVSTTGAYGGSTSACDETARWETGATGFGLTPSWTDYTGGDTTYAVAVTGTAVYVGGHMRWENNAFAGDSAGPGAVAREGIAALDPTNGLPLAWDPGRTKGVGVFDFLATPQGLWVGSDTDRIGHFSYRARIALMPLAGGEVIPPTGTGTLPGDVYLAGRTSVPDPSILYRVNAGGPTIPAVSTGPDWAADTDGSPDPHHNSGSNTAGFGGGETVDGTVPSSTPTAIFDDERWDPGDATEMHWGFDVPAGQQVQVRLFFANRYSGTSQPGQRVFSVAIDGTTKLSNYDIVADVGDQKGTMKAFDVTSDGTVDIDFTHAVENPLIDGIEIVRTDLPPTNPASLDDLQKRSFNGTTAGATTTLPDAGIAWGQTRGAVMINGVLHYGWSDGNFYSRTFNGTTFGAQTPVNAQDQIVNLAAWHSDIPSITSMFFANGRLYYTLAGQSQLFYRYFTPESKVIGAVRFTAPGSASGLDLSQAAGAFLDGTDLYVASRSDGALRKVGFSNGSLSGTATVVSGPAQDGADWRARGLFLYAAAGAGVNQPPVANATVNCTGLDCTADGSASSDPDGTITSYAWNFGDAGTATGATATHTYAAPGTYNVQLTVIDNDGASNTTTKSVTVSQPTAPVSFVGKTSANGNATAETVTVPAGVATGDGMLLFATEASATVTIADPAGWTLVSTAQSASGVTTKVWQRVATAGQAGSNVTVNFSGIVKADVTLSAYHGTAPTGPVATAFASATETATTANHVTPTLTTGSPAWVVSYWADNSSATTSWTAPAGQTTRSTTAGTGGGHVSTLVTDSGAPKPAGSQGGLTGTANSASGKGTMWTLVLSD